MSFVFWAVNGQPAPYPSLAVRARNGRVVDKPPGTQKQKINIGASRATGLLKKRHFADSVVTITTRRKTSV
jgi:hypothetical protein